MSRDIISLANGTIIETAINNGTEEGGVSSCKQYVYDRSVYKSTTTSEVQNNNYLAASFFAKAFLPCFLDNSARIKSKKSNEMKLKLKELKNVYINLDSQTTDNKYFFFTVGLGL